MVITSKKAKFYKIVHRYFSCIYGCIIKGYIFKYTYFLLKALLGLPLNSLINRIYMEPTAVVRFLYY